MNNASIHLPPLFRLDTILHACENGRVILTPTQRLRDKVQQAWNQHQQSQQSRAWKPFRIFSLAQWFDDCWQQLQASAYEPSFQSVASAQQEQVLWEQIVDDFGLMRSDALAKQAASAYKTMQLWQLSISQSEDEYIADSLPTQTFKHWCSDYEKRLVEQRLLSSEHRLPIITRSLAANVLHREDTLYLLGFNDLPPLYKAVLEQLFKQLVNVDLCTHQPQRLQRLTFADCQSEMRAVAHWSKAILKKTPHTRIGIIVPDLGRRRSEIERVFREVFNGQTLWANQPVGVLPINISAGVPLGENPLVADALELLRFYQDNWRIQEFIPLLNSPFWGELSTQRPLRCRLARRLEALGVFKLSFSEIRYQLQKLCELEEKNDFSLLQIFSTVAEYIRHHRRPAAPSVWAERFLKCLALLQWPGERPSNSLEHQQSKQWYELLESFATLDEVSGDINESTAIDRLNRMAWQQPFQPELPDTPIQILGVLEASGLHFDHCWFLGLDQQSWPPAPQPNPLLPIPLQRRLGMPHASHERELLFAESLTRQFRHCAENIIFSSPSSDPETELSLSPSTLIQDIPLLTDFESTLSDFEIFNQRLFETREFETISCVQAPPVNASEFNAEGELAGGAGVIKAQASNPFNAFAIWRLNARRPQRAVLGFSAIEQGNILHQSLATIWRRLGNQQQLSRLTDDDIYTFTRESVSEAVKTARQHKRDHLGNQLCELEIDRQVSLIVKWLDYEKKRPAFHTVAIEESLYFNNQNIKLKLRIDRVDRLADGGFLILDYKTGASHLREWRGERLIDPQLPLYLLSYPEPVIGIAFAQINLQDQTLVGLEDGKHPGDGLIPIDKNRIELPDNWEEAKNLWRQRIQYLLEAYLAGACPVDYRDNTELSRSEELLVLNRYFDKYRIIRA